MRDAEQKPIADARVCASIPSLDALGALPASCTHTNQRGAYVLGELAARTYAVGAIASGYVAAAALDGLSVPLRPGEVRRDLDIVLQKGAFNVHGSVLDATGGVVPHARVRAERASPPLSVVDVECDEFGRFALSLAAGPVVFTASADGYAPAHQVRVAPSAHTELVLTPGASLRGVVLGAEDGRPVADVEVRAQPLGPRESAEIPSAHSDASGRFEISGLEPGAYGLVASGARVRGELPMPLDVGLGETIEGIQIAVAKAAQVSGRVTFEDGSTPCERGAVVLGGPDPFYPPPEESAGAIAQHTKVPPTVSTNIDADGLVRLPAVVSGHYHVSVLCDENILRAGPRVIDVGTRDVQGLLWKVGGGASLTVLAVDARERPVPGVEFTLQMPAWTPNDGIRQVVGRSDERGLSEFAGVLSPGTYRVVPGSWYGVDAVQVVVRDGEPAQAKLKLPGSANIEAEIRVAGGGPIERLTVVATPLAGADSARMSESLASESGGGRYTMAGLPAGKYQLRVDDGINATFISEAYELRADTPLKVRLELPRGGQISGRVVDEHGAPMADVWVTVSADALVAAGGLGMQRAAYTPARPARVLSDPDGRFAFSALATSATYTLQADQPRGTSARVRAVRTQTTNLSIVMHPVGTIAGDVIGACSDSAASQVAIQAQNVDTGQLLGPLNVDKRGRFLLEGVAPGEVQISAFCSDGLVQTYGQVTARLSPSQQLEGVQLALQAPSVTSPTEQL